MIVAAMGASLVAMVSRITLENEAYASHHARLQQIVERSEALRMQCETAREEDEAAYRRVVEAMALPKATPEEKTSRTRTLQEALHEAALAPLNGAELALNVMRLASDALAAQNRNLVSDVGCAAEFAGSAVTACAYNVRINHRFMKDAETVARQVSVLERYERDSAALLKTIRDEVNKELA